MEEVVHVRGNLSDPTNDRITLWVYTTDCDAALARLRDGRVRVVQEPTDQQWGERMAIVEDPDGNRVIIATRSPEEHA